MAELKNEHRGSPRDSELVGLDIQDIISEFGGFEDFFEDDVLPLGAPPGTMEKGIFCTGDCCILCNSVKIMDPLDLLYFPDGSPPSENSYQPLPSAAEKKVTREIVQAAPPIHTSDLDHSMKVEAMPTYVAEFGPVGIPSVELSPTIVGSPYVPASREGANQDLSYCATPPAYPFFSKSHRIVGADDYYTYVDSTEELRASVMGTMVKRMHQEEILKETRHR